MQLQVQRRAEIALRSLNTADRQRIDRALNELASADPRRGPRLPKFHSLATGFSGKPLFAYRAGRRLRLILSFNDDLCVVEDIVDHDKLDRLLRVPRPH